MKAFLLISLLFLSSSCAYLLGKPRDAHNSLYLDKQTELSHVSSEQIKVNLERNEMLSGGNFQLYTYPVTEALVWKQSVEEAAARSLNVEEIFVRKKAELTDDKTCLKVRIEVKEYEKVTDIRKWMVTLEDANGLKSTANWLPNYTREFPILDETASYQGTKTMWHNDGIACVAHKMSVKDGLTANFKSPWVQFPFEKEVSTSWKFDQYKVDEESGETVLVKKADKKKRKPYRGW